MFNDKLKEVCEEKLTRPLERHKVDLGTARFDLDASIYRESVGLRVRLNMPGVVITVSTLHPDAQAALDLAVDKLSRKLRDIDDRRRAMRRRQGAMPELADEGEDIFTEDEEEVLREMGALDAVLNA